MYYKEEDEMTEVEIRLRYGSVIDEAVSAFRIDPNYSADVAKKARNILARRNKSFSD